MFLILGSSLFLSVRTLTQCKRMNRKRPRVVAREDLLRHATRTCHSVYDVMNIAKVDCNGDVVS